MKYLLQFCVILLFSFLGELFHMLLPFPIPASIYGMVLLFAALCLKLVRPEQVRDTGHFLVNIMAVMFVSPAVGLLKCWDLVKENWFSISFIIVVSLLITFFVTGKVTQMLLREDSSHA